MLLLGSASARANEGTIRELVVPALSPIVAATPRPSLHYPSWGGWGAGTLVRVTPVSFYAKGSVPEVVLVPQLDIDAVGSKDWTTTPFRFALTGRAIVFPAGGTRSSFGYLGVALDGGGSLGFGGPSSMWGTGLLVGGAVGTIGVVYRRAHGRDQDVQSVILDFSLTYPIALRRDSER